MKTELLILMGIPLKVYIDIYNSVWYNDKQKVFEITEKFGVDGVGSVK